MLQRLSLHGRLQAFQVRRFEAAYYMNGPFVVIQRRGGCRQTDVFIGRSANSAGIPCPFLS